MTTLLRNLAIGAILCGALMFGTSTAFAGPPSTTIVTNGNNNINIVVNIQAPTINLNVPSFPIGGYGAMGPMGPGPGCQHQHPALSPTQNLILNQGNGNVNQLRNFGPGPSQTQIMNFGDMNRNFVRNRGW